MRKCVWYINKQLFIDLGRRKRKFFQMNTTILFTITHITCQIKVQSFMGYLFLAYISTLQFQRYHVKFLSGTIYDTCKCFESTRLRPWSKIMHFRNKVENLHSTSVLFELYLTLKISFWNLFSTSSLRISRILLLLSLYDRKMEFGQYIFCHVLNLK